MSIIPKIRVGLDNKKREKISLNFDNSTTANIGSIQPTMCRELIPDSKVSVKVSSLVRLASMSVPTFGRMSLRHYHTFVPIKDLWQPFESMLAGQHYKGSATSPFVPTRVPTFDIGYVVSYMISNYADVSIAPADNLDKPYTITSNNVDYAGVAYSYGEDTPYATYQDAVRAAQAADLARIQTVWDEIRGAAGTSKAGWFGNYDEGLFPYNNTVGSLNSDDKGVLCLGSMYAALTSGASTNYQTQSLIINYSGVSNGNVTIGDKGVITPEGADFITKTKTVGAGVQARQYYLLFKLKAPLKRLRTIFIGLGYQFTPYNHEQQSILKLFAYYKAWFTLFSPVRQKSFVDTNCYKLIKKVSDSDGISSALDFSTKYGWNFIFDLMNECYYYLPMDYFSMATLQPEQSNQDVNISLAAVQGTSNTTAIISSLGNQSTTSSIPAVSNASPIYPIIQRLASRLLTFANKNTVVGRNIREYLKVHYGIDDATSIDTEGVYRVGSSRTNIQISDVMSTAETNEGALGEYAGRGIGYGDSETFDFTCDDFGYFITLTAVVPESGYYQGYLRENRHIGRFDFFNSAFDALGYQVLERGEVMDDYNCDDGTDSASTRWIPMDINGISATKTYNRTAAFGLIPRYSEYKVGRNICNGDISLVGLRNSMAAYSLDRRIAGGQYANLSINSDGEVNRVITKPSFVPSVVYDAFRRIDPTDHLGQYNRIFNYTENDLDHFIVHNIFNVDLYAPMKSLATSFDTIGEDENSMEVTHS